MHYKMKLWSGIGAASLLQATLVGPLIAANPEKPTAAITSSGGEAGESGEGGEAGIDPQAARHDAAVYITALDVIRAHYLAGELAYAAKNRAGAHELFVHPISEVYVDLAPVLKERGAVDFQKAMENAGELAGRSAGLPEIKTAVKKVLEATDRAEEKAPESQDLLSTNVRLISEFLGRAARQYRTSLESSEEEPYMDGLGLYLVVKQRAERQADAIGARSSDALKSVRAAIDLLGQAYPGVDRRSGQKVDLSQLLAAVSTAQLNLSGIQ